MVNAFAAAALAAGFFALSSAQREADALAREGARAFSPAERALIDEIRRETSASLAAQDREIGEILSSLGDAEARLREFLDAGGALTDEQREERDRLFARQEERRGALAQARQDRSRILDEARHDEAELRDRRDSRARQRAGEEGREPGGPAGPDRPGRARGEAARQAEEAGAREMEYLRARRGERAEGAGRPAGRPAEEAGSAGGELAALQGERRRAAAEEGLERGIAARQRIGELEGQIGALQEALGIEGGAPFEALLESVRLLAEAAGGAQGEGRRPEAAGESPGESGESPGGQDAPGTGRGGRPRG
jgi:hypothetical protein